MSLGLPTHLAEETMSRALRRAMNAFGLVCLGGALIVMVSVALRDHVDGMWPSVVALVPMGVLLALLSRRRTLGLSIAYLVVGSLAIFVYSHTIFTATQLSPASDMFVISLPAMALVMVGGAGVGALAGILWSTGGLLLGEGAVILAAVMTGIPVHADMATLGTWALVAGVLAYDAGSRDTARAAQSSVLRAARADQASAWRHDLELSASAYLHDTALSQLVAIGAAEPGAVDPRLRERINGELALLVGQDWLLTRVRGPVTTTPSEAWKASEIRSAIADARAEGLTVAVTGDPETVADLSGDTALALGQAVRQCLVNVVRHSGVVNAEVAVSGTRDDVSVLVIDAGGGFTIDTAPAESLGLRHSVRQRIERVGGAVSIWSQPGEGTSVLLTVPRGDLAERPPRATVEADAAVSDSSEAPR